MSKQQSRIETKGKRGGAQLRSSRSYHRLLQSRYNSKFRIYQIEGNNWSWRRGRGRGRGREGEGDEGGTVGGHRGNLEELLKATDGRRIFRIQFRHGEAISVERGGEFDMARMARRNPERRRELQSAKIPPREKRASSHSPRLRLLGLRNASGDNKSLNLRLESNFS